jgi:SulP family sulfate permease
LIVETAFSEVFSILPYKKAKTKHDSMKSHYWQDFSLRPVWWSGVNRRSMKADFWAGLTNAIVVLPQGIAFALIAGLPPVYGIYTAIVPAIVAGFFGSSLHLISGPNTAVSLAIFAAVSPLVEPGSAQYFADVLTLTFLVGVVQLFFGLARLGIFVNFVSHTVVVGFTTGAALLIISSQLKNISGIAIPNGLGAFQTWQYLFSHWQGFKGEVFMVAAASFVVSVLFKRWSKKWPFLVFGSIAGAGLAQLLGGTSADIQFVGAIPRSLPPFSWPHFDIVQMRILFPDAFALAMIGLIQTVAISKGLASQSGQRINNNREFFGQGLSNLVASFFSSFASSGSFTRSALNYQSGAQTPLSGGFSALVLMVIVLFISPLAAYLPIPTMGGIILLVALNLIDLQEIRRIFRSSRMETTVFSVTFLATLLFDLEYAILLGIITSLSFFLYKISTPHIAIMAPDPVKPDNSLTYIVRKPELRECSQIKLVRIDGPIFYGSVEHIAAFFDTLRQSEAKYCLLLCEGVNFIGLAGAQWLSEEAELWKKRGGGLYFSNLKVIAQDVLNTSGYKNQIGADHFFLAKKEAIHHLYSLIPDEVCANCEQRVFGECRAKARKCLEEGC